MPSLLRRIFDLLFRLLTRRSVSGLEHVPAQGPYLLVSNHLSRLDAPLIYALIGGAHLTGWAAEKYERHLLFGTILRLGGGIFIRRGEVDREALQSAVEWLHGGKVFGMSPEGTRSKTGGLIRGKTGAAYLVQQTSVAVVPAAVWGTESAIAQLLRLRRPEVFARFGHPFSLPGFDEGERAAGLRRNTDEIMCRIAALLPPEYRGVYADHARLAQLLAGTH
ncbi:MAG: lysophospholipid acyltransferase family protein [Chloroflexota bacterium]